MDDLEAVPPPCQILHSDGRTEPFDPNRLHHTLFAATKLRGQADAFLSRELTDSILPFLAERATNGSVTTTETVDVAVAVLRELGHAVLAQHFQEVLLLEKTVHASPPSVQRHSAISRAVQQRLPTPELAQVMVKEAMTAFTLEEVYPPYVVAAHQEGLLTLGQLPALRELASAVVRWPERAYLSWLQAQRVWIGEEVVFDAPDREWHLLQLSEAARWECLCQFALGCRLLGLRVAVHLNCHPPPAWAMDAEPPLFPTGDAAGQERHHALRMQLLHLWEQFPQTVRLFWHVREKEQGHECAEPLERLLATTRSGNHATLIVDGIPAMVHLHDGLDRRHSSLLQTLTLHLDILAERQGQPLTLDGLAGKTLSLVRLALGAAKARREYLRRWRLPGWPAFVLDQAHVCLNLSGWENTIPRLAEAMPPEELRPALVQRLVRILEREARYLNLTAVLDYPIIHLPGFSGTPNDLLDLLRQAPGTKMVHL